MYGLYLTISSWVLFVVVTRSEFFHDHLGMFSLNTQQGGAPRLFRGFWVQDNPRPLPPNPRPLRNSWTRHGACGPSACAHSKLECVVLLALQLGRKLGPRSHMPGRPFVQAPCCVVLV